MEPGILLAGLETGAESSLPMAEQRCFHCTEDFTGLQDAAWIDAVPKASTTQSLLNVTIRS